jgi:two-component system sensor histidine kinase HupT/HoxJ
MISQPMFHILNLTCTILIVFMGSCIMKGDLTLMQRLYMILIGSLAGWILALLGMYYTPKDNMDLLFAFDAVTCIAQALTASSMLLAALSFTKNYKKMPRRNYVFLIPPAITALVVTTNPLHGLFYREFSIIASQVKFGPLFLINGALYYIYYIIAMIICLYNGRKSNHPLFVKQAAWFSIGIFIPLFVNVMATLKIADLTIAATPIAFVGTIVCHGIAVYALNFLNIKPVAVQRVFDSISDCYAIISIDGYIVNANKSFYDVFGDFGIHPEQYLSDLAAKLDERNRDIAYNLISSYESCMKSGSTISYEQSLLTESGKKYYAVEITAVNLKKNTSAFIAMFKDITRIKEETQREQQLLSMSMERERLASLGQMIGGIAHNLKTPIMSISGSVHALANLTDEYQRSIGDKDVTKEDHQEIGHEMSQWQERIKECCGYMSDIITTVKGLATNMNTSRITAFSLDEVFKRVHMLMQNNIIRNSCTLVEENELPRDLVINGDVNNLVQVVNNLVENSIDAMTDQGGGPITIGAKLLQGNILIYVRDRGNGIPEDVKGRLFKEMVTSKGAQGAGIGLYTSNTLIRGKFGGKMWIEDNPEGGTITNVLIPLDLPGSA